LAIISLAVLSPAVFLWRKRQFMMHTPAQAVEMAVQYVKIRPLCGHFLSVLTLSAQSCGMGDPKRASSPQSAPQ
jgi:hypothetical protein